jgi:hypothetical protein
VGVPVVLVIVVRVAAIRVCSASLSATIVTTWANASTLPTDVPPNFMTNMGVSSNLALMHCYFDARFDKTVAVEIATATPNDHL